MVMKDNNNGAPHDDGVNEAMLIKYLEGKLSDEERFAVESQMADSAFVNDAVEGLESFTNKNDIQPYLTDLNAQLKKHTSHKKSKKLKRKLPDMGWILITLVIVILLCVMGYIILRMHEKDSPKIAPSSITQ